MLDIQTIMIIVILALGAVIAVYNFYKLGKEKQLEKVREWLLLAVTMAEKEFGSKTGQLKLRYVYEMFISKFRFMSIVISFDTFSEMVDDALDDMRDMIQNNKAVEELIIKR